MDKLHLKANKVRILKVFLPRLPYMLDKKCTCDVSIQGFIDIGMLDVKHKCRPYFMQFEKQREEVSPDLKCK